MVGSQALQKYRHERQLTQSALALELGVSSISVSRWETGERRIGRHYLRKVVEVTGIPAAELRPDIAALLEPPAPAADQPETVLPAAQA